MSRTLMRELLSAYPEKSTYASLVQHGNEDPELVVETQWHFDGKDCANNAKALSELYPEKAKDGFHKWGQIPPWVMNRALREGWDQKAWKRWMNGAEGQANCTWRKGKGRRPAKA